MISGAFSKKSSIDKLCRFSSPLLYGLTSIGLVIPCVWQERIEAGDLSSHVYNAWLASRIAHGGIKNLVVEPRWNNILADWILSALLPPAGPIWTEKLVAAGAVLLFFWSALYFLRVTSGRTPWPFVPILAMISYGLVFHMGLLNCYVSTGLCLLIMAFLWRPLWPRSLVAIPLAILAVLAHLLPVMWASSILTYMFVWRRVPEKRRPWMLLAGVLALLAADGAIMSFLPYRGPMDWLLGVRGVAGFTGVEQVWNYGGKYLLIACSLLAVWWVLLLRRLDKGNLLGDGVAQIWLLHIFGFLILPITIQLPAEKNVFGYIPERLSLFNALLFCATAAGVRFGRYLVGLSAIVCALYFSFLYIDTRAYDKVENELKRVIDTVPANARVVAQIEDSNSELNDLMYVAAQACIGRCFSYANYEPATGQFRVHALGPNPVVVATMDLLREFESGGHVVTAAEAPVYSLCTSADPASRFEVRKLETDGLTCVLSVRVSPTLPDIAQLFIGRTNSHSIAENNFWAYSRTAEKRK